MKCFYLKSTDQNPPGGYPFEQTTGIYKKFPAQPLIEAQGSLVSQFRQGNNLPRASVPECIEDISCYTCFRLGNNPVYCRSSDAPLLTSNVTIPIPAPCKGCGAPLTV